MAKKPRVTYFDNAGSDEEGEKDDSDPQKQSLALFMSNRDVSAYVKDSPPHPLLKVFWLDFLAFNYFSSQPKKKKKKGTSHPVDPVKALQDPHGWV